MNETITLRAYRMLVALDGIEDQGELWLTSADVSNIAGGWKLFAKLYEQGLVEDGDDSPVYPVNWTGTGPKRHYRLTDTARVILQEPTAYLSEWAQHEIARGRLTDGLR